MTVLSDDRAEPVIDDGDRAGRYARRAETANLGRSGRSRCLSARLADVLSVSRTPVVEGDAGEEIIPLLATLPGPSLLAVDPAESMRQCKRRRLSQARAGSKSFQGCMPPVASTGRCAAVTSLRVARHVQTGADVLDRFRAIISRLVPGGRWFTADLHTGLKQDRARLIHPWRQQAHLSGIEMGLVEGGAQRVPGEMRPGTKELALSLLNRGGFDHLCQRFLMLLHGAGDAPLATGARS